MENFRHFVVSLSAALFFGVASIVFVAVWVSHYGEGVAWDGGPAEFNWHPVLVVSGFIFLQGLGERSLPFFLLFCCWRDVTLKHVVEMVARGYVGRVEKLLLITSVLFTKAKSTDLSRKVLTITYL